MIICFLCLSELTKNPRDIVIKTLKVMQLYQQLSPTLFAQVGFSVAKLLSETAGSRGLLADPCVLSPTLKLVMETTQESLRCLHEVSTVGNSVWLLVEVRCISFL